MFARPNRSGRAKAAQTSRSLSSGLYRRPRNCTGSADIPFEDRSRALAFAIYRRWGIAPRPENICHRKMTMEIYDRAATGARVRMSMAWRAGTHGDKSFAGAHHRHPIVLSII